MLAFMATPKSFWSFTWKTKCTSGFLYFLIRQRNENLLRWNYPNVGYYQEMMSLRKVYMKNWIYQKAMWWTIKSSFEIRLHYIEYILCSPNSGQYLFPSELNNLLREISKRGKCEFLFRKEMKYILQINELKVSTPGYTWKLSKCLHLAYFILKYPQCI